MARRRRRRKHRVSPPAALAALAGALLAISLLVRAIREFPLVAAAVAATVLVAGGIWLHLRSAAGRRLAEHERDIAVTDTMSGPEFEHYIARLMRAGGCRGVRVSGGSGDMGADVTARAPDGRRVVVQCKRYTGPLGSPHVQRFAGTARDIHGADVALLVTTGHPTRQARDVARRCRIVLVDRSALARWVSTGVPPLP